MQQQLRGADPRSVRHWNEITVLETLQQLGTARIRAIRDVTGITPGPLGQVLTGLVDKGWVTSAQADIEGPGRPAQVYSIAWPAGFVIGFDIGRRTVRGVVVDLSGEQSAQAERPLPSSPSRQQVTEACEALVDELLDGASREEVWAAAVAVSGLIDEDGTLRASDALPWLEGSSPADLLEGVLDVPVSVAADQRAALVSENRRGAGANAGEFMMLSLGERVTLTTISRGLPRRGAHNAAGDVSRLPIHHALDVSGWTGEGGSGFADLAAGIAAIAAGDDSATASLLADVDRMAQDLALAVAVVDPDVLVIGGAVRPVAEIVIDRLRERLADLLETPPTLHGAEVDELGVARGASDLARFRILSTLGSRETGLLSLSRAEFHARVPLRVEVA